MYQAITEEKYEAQSTLSVLESLPEEMACWGSSQDVILT